MFCAVCVVDNNQSLGLVSTTYAGRLRYSSCMQTVDCVTVQLVMSIVLSQTD